MVETRVSIIYVVSHNWLRETIIYERACVGLFIRQCDLCIALIFDRLLIPHVPFRAIHHSDEITGR